MGLGRSTMAAEAFELGIQVRDIPLPTQEKSMLAGSFCVMNAGIR
jgi:hypothetical protein